MTATMNFQFPPTAGRDSYIPPSSNYCQRKQSTSAASYIGSFVGSSTTSPYQPVEPKRIHHTPSIPEIPSLGEGISHGKLHKRRTSKSSNHSRQSPSKSDAPYAPTIEEDNTRWEKSNPRASRTISKDKLMHNLRKLSTHKGSDADTDVIDLSLTAAENREKSGLRLYSSITDMRTQIVNTSDPAGRIRGHSRSTSQNSYTAFQPTAPFALPMRASTFPYHVASVQQNGAEGENRSRAGLLEDAETPAMACSTVKPMYMDLPSTPSLEGVSQSSTPPVTRPRRGTDRSYDALTPISRTSTDRAFSFKRIPKDEPVDYMARAASIQAARQVFQEKEDAKARKYEKQEQKAMERQQRKETKEEIRQQKHFDVLERVVTSTEKDAPIYGGSAVTRSTTNKRNQQEMSSSEEKETVSRKKAARSRYRRFITWLKTRLFYLGRGMKSGS